MNSDGMGSDGMRSDRAKSAIDEALLPSPRTLPGTNLSLARIATRIARNARPLLRANQGFLLSITRSTKSDRAPLSICFWDARGTLALLPPMAGGGALRRHHAALEADASVLLVDLLCRWPANAIPPAVGIFTDGGGVALSSDHPSPQSPDWLARHQAGLCPTTTLLPFRPNGAWSRLVAPTIATSVH